MRCLGMQWTPPRVSLYKVFVARKRSVVAYGCALGVLSGVCVCIAMGVLWGGVKVGVCIAMCVHSYGCALGVLRGVCA